MAITDAGAGPSRLDAGTPPKVPAWNDPKIRGLFWQGLLLVAILLLAYGAGSNVVDNLRRAGIASGFGFWGQQAGFDVNQHLVPFSSADPASTYGQAFIVGLLNTLLVGAIGVVLTTFLGFAIGIARLSKNWFVAKLARVYVEVIRNTPLLLQLFFCYNAVLKPLPEPRDAINPISGVYLHNRGLIVPTPVFGDTAWLIGAALLAGVVLAFAFRAYAQSEQTRTGRRLPVGLTALGLIVGLPLLAFAVLGAPITLQMPVRTRFNITGSQIFPEFVALVLGLVIYTAAFIAEIVRAGIQAVSKGQTEAAGALGLRAGPILDLVVVPQAMRVIIPPLTNQYLNLVKNSSLAVAIGYPDLVQVFAGTVLNQTGQAVEVIVITMAVYLTISLVTSAVMNAYNQRKALVER